MAFAMLHILLWPAYRTLTISVHVLGPMNQPGLYWLICQLAGRSHSSICSSICPMQKGPPCYSVLYSPMGQPLVEGVMDAVRMGQDPALPRELLKGMSSAAEVGMLTEGCLEYTFEI